MAINKTTQTDSSVSAYLKLLTDPLKRADCYELVNVMQKISSFEPKMWGASIVGFGSYHYVYASGHQGDAPLLAFAPRKTAIVIYLATDFPEKTELLSKLGKHKKGVGCLYVKKLDDIAIEILEKLIEKYLEALKKLYP